MMPAWTIGEKKGIFVAGDDVGEEGWRCYHPCMHASPRAARVYVCDTGSREEARLRTVVKEKINVARGSVHVQPADQTIDLP